eukprot:COSAG06_NODE_30923_length_530_cov_0.649652_1_plen_99_part_00
MVTARKKEPTPIEPRFGEPTDDQWGEEVHYKDGSGSGMAEVISRTANLDYGSFTLPQKSRKWGLDRSAGSVRLASLGLQPLLLPASTAPVHTAAAAAR